MTLPSFLTMTQRDWLGWFGCFEAATSPSPKKFRVEQLYRHVYVKNNLDPLLFSDMPMLLRQQLAQSFIWVWPEVDSVLTSQIDGSAKILLKWSDHTFAECVLMPSPHRVTLCISSQVGCRMGCTFCQTGRMGLTRNLTSGEILAQLTVAQKHLGPERKITNVVFMGMGEPLDNYDCVVEACQVMIAPRLFGLSKHKVTVSTSGLVPEIQRLGHDVPVALAISLHSTNDDERSRLMPVNRNYPLSVLKAALLEYPLHTRHGITFEYVMIAGENDSLAHAKSLVKFLHGLKAKVNLIPMNPHPDSPFVASSQERLMAFQKYLSDRSIPSPIRYSRGPDISGACGQLAAKRKDELHLSPRKTARARWKEKKDQNFKYTQQA